MREDRREPDEVLHLIYGELRNLAGAYMRRERPGHTLQPTALVHEAYLRVARNTRMSWQGRTHVFAMAAREMRRVLAEHARKRNAGKRRWGQKVSLTTDVAFTAEPTVDFLSLHEALDRLSALSPRQCEVAELRFFAGLEERDIARHLGVSERTVRQDWLVARTWLARELRR